MEPLSQYHAAAAFEQALGDPHNPDNVLSFSQAVVWDEIESFPQEALELLYDLGINEYYVPVAYGGRLSSYEEFLGLARVLARRNMTAAVTFSTLVWSTMVWIAGQEHQKRRCAEVLRSSRQAPCLAYSEEDHGADLLANEVRAEPVEGGYRLSGEKWPINRATKGGIVALLARTSHDRGSRNLSLFWLEKSQLDSATYHNLAPVKTLGLRGCDISGIRFDASFAAEHSRIGAEGEGLEIALKSFQVTRTLCAGLSLGTVDTALRTTLDFALTRKLYNNSVFDISHARSALAETFVDLLVCECMGIAAARGLHVSTEQFSVWSAVVKYFVPVTMERAIQQLAVILGARYYLREKHRWGIFQKMLRDNAVVSLFDGSTVVNLNALSLQMRHLLRARPQAGQDPARSRRLVTILSLDQPLPPFDGRRLDLFSHGRDDLVQGLPELLQDLGARQDEPTLQEVRPQLLRLGQFLLDTLDALQVPSRGEDATRAADPQSPAAFEVARRYCLVHAGAACLGMWLHNRHRLDHFFAEGRWLVMALDRLARQLRPDLPDLPAAYTDAVAQQLRALHQGNRLFSILPFDLASRDSNQEVTRHEVECC